MIQAPLRIDVAQVDGSVVIAAIGDLDIATVSTFAMVVEDATVDAHRVVFDLYAVGYMDSSGLHTIISTHQEVSARGGEVVVGRASPQVRRLMELTGLDRPLGLPPVGETHAATHVDPSLLPRRP